MAGMIIWCITVFGCAALFLGIGIYAQKSEKPMWFWAGTTVDESKITDVKAYNKENARMWVLYSLWFWTSGAIYFWNGMISVMILVLGCTVGIGFLVGSFTKIEKKYKRK